MKNEIKKDIKLLTILSFCLIIILTILYKINPSQTLNLITGLIAGGIMLIGITLIEITLKKRGKIN